jgi:hypothetical protein
MLMLWSGVALVQNKKFFTSAPKDIQEVIQEKPERFKGAHLLGYTLALISVLCIVGAFVFGAVDGIKNGFTFWQFFARFLIMLYLYKAFDMIFLDWFLLTKSHFFQYYYPETEGCKGFHSYGFNKKSQIVKIIIFPFASLAAAGICMLF